MNQNLSKCRTVTRNARCGFADELRRIEAHLACRLMGCVRNLRVHRHENGLIIRGSTSTYYIKQLVQEAVMEITCRPILANEIEVR